MARSAGRKSVLSLVLAAVVVCLAGRWAIAQTTAFVQPRAPKESGSSNHPEVAAVGALATLASALPAEAIPGPLAGSEVCTQKPLVWFIYPLCDLVFLAAPTYFFPLIAVFYGVITITIQLLIPATQPDEDLR